MLIIRPISKADNAPIAQMIRAVFDEYGAVTDGTVYTDPTTDYLSKVFEQKNAVLFVAEYNGEIHGCCGIFPTTGLPKSHTELVKFYVSKQFRGTGLGRQLFEKCEKKAIEYSYSHLYLESTPDFNQAVGIYKKIGFVSLPKPLGDSGHYGCTIWMKKEIG